MSTTNSKVTRAAGPIRPLRKVVSDLGVVSRRHPERADILEDLRRELRAAQLADHIERVVSEAPELTEEQRSALAALLTGGAR